MTFPKKCLALFAMYSLSFALMMIGASAAGKPRALSDEDILSPSKLIFDQVVDFIDSFDGSLRGKVFVTKRSILGSPYPEYGILGEKGSPRYKENCQWFCPPQTTDIDAIYLYVFEVKGECEIGVRAIGWVELVKSDDGLLRHKRVTGIVRYTAQPVNIDHFTINNAMVGPPSNKDRLSGPHGTNYKYFPRHRWNFSQTTADSADLSAGFMTDIHYFSATDLVNAIRSGEDIVIKFDAWKPSVMKISGKPLHNLKSLVESCLSQ